MSRTYTPRRASARWLDGDCPADVLCLLDSGPRSGADRWTVFYRHVWQQYPAHHGSSIFGRSMSDHPSHPCGVGCSLDMQPHEVAALRYRTRSVRWSDLPADVQACIRRDCQPGGLGSRLDEKGADMMRHQHAA